MDLSVIYNNDNLQITDDDAKNVFLKSFIFFPNTIACFRKKRRNHLLMKILIYISMKCYFIKHKYKLIIFIQRTNTSKN